MHSRLTRYDEISLIDRKIHIVQFASVLFFKLRNHLSKTGNKNKLKFLQKNVFSCFTMLKYTGHA